MGNKCKDNQNHSLSFMLLYCWICGTSMERSAYAHLLNPELNQACRAITGCLRPTNVETLDDLLEFNDTAQACIERWKKIAWWYDMMMTQTRQLHSLHTTPSRIQHTTWTTNIQHHTPHEHQPQKTTYNTKHRTQNSNWVYNRHKHTSTRRSIHTTRKGTPTITRITYKANITTPRRKKQTTYNTEYTTDIDTTIDDAKIKTNMNIFTPP